MQTPILSVAQQYNTTIDLCKQTDASLPHLPTQLWAGMDRGINIEFTEALEQDRLGEERRGEENSPP